MGKFTNIEDYEADEKLEEVGIDLSFGKGRFITIVRSGLTNRKYRSVLASTFKPHTIANGKISLSDDEANDLMKKVYAKSVVIGWKGFKDKDNKDIPFNEKNCVELFTDSPEIYNIVQDQSSKFSNFAIGEVKDAGK